MQWNRGICYPRHCVSGAGSESVSNFRLVGVPISACPSDDEAVADKELEDIIITRCYGPSACKNTVSAAAAADGEGPSPSSSSCPVPSTSNLNFPPQSPKPAADDDDGNENIDEIVQDHDNFGTDENEDSMDSIMDADHPFDDHDLPATGTSVVEDSLSALGEVESCCGGGGGSALRSGSKRKSDGDSLSSNGGTDGDGRADLVKVKKQCIDDAFREQGLRQEVRIGLH